MKCRMAELRNYDELNLNLKFEGSAVFNRF